MFLSNFYWVVLLALQCTFVVCLLCVELRTHGWFPGNYTFVGIMKRMSLLKNKTIILNQMRVQNLHKKYNCLTNHVTNMKIIKVKSVPLQLGRAQSYIHRNKMNVETLVNQDKVYLSDLR